MTFHMTHDLSPVIHFSLSLAGDVCLSYCGNDSLDSGGWELFSFGFLHQRHAQILQLKDHPLQQRLPCVCPVLWQLCTKTHTGLTCRHDVYIAKNMAIHANHTNTLMQMGESHENMFGSHFTPKWKIIGKYILAGLFVQIMTVCVHSVCFCAVL